jgi:hypothetical protein
MGHPEVTEPSGITDSQRSAYRVFGYSAIAHSALIFLGLFLIIRTRDSQPLWLPSVEILWAGMVTLWFFWPIILALHVGRSAKRAYVSVGVASVIFALPCLQYLRFEGPRVFMPEEMISFSPYDLVPYGISYGQGWIEAKRRSGATPILLEGYGFGGQGTPGAPPFSKEALQKYGIQIDPIAGCGVTPRIQGHARGYNRASVAEIKRRWGPDVIPKADQEEVVRQKRFQDFYNAGIAAAQSDIRARRLAILICGPTRKGEDEYRNLLRTRYQIELTRVLDADTEIDEDTWARVLGYNEIISAEVRQRFGTEAETAVFCATERFSFEDFLRKIEFQREHGS